jgi:hypothetical protein
LLADIIRSAIAIIPVKKRRFWGKNNDSKSDFGVFAGKKKKKTAISDPNLPFLDQERRFQVQHCNFLGKKRRF